MRADDRKKQRKCWEEKQGRLLTKNTPAKKGKGVPCQEKCANLMRLKQIFKETS